VIEETIRRARAAGRAAVLVTFEPHPLAVLRPAAAPFRLTTAAERAARLAETELDYLVVLRFTPALARLEPAAFVDRILRERCQMEELVVGHDHGFGRGRTGDLELLRSLGVARGFGVEVVEPVVDRSGRIVSSSAIRAAVADGDLVAAAGQLGRPYRISGEVERGDRRGRSIGVPTANLEPPADKLLPPDGVYAVRVEYGDGVAGGMMNQGARPTVGDDRRLLETHLFDVDRNLYGRTIRIEWVAWIRPTQRFDSVGALRDQLARDAETARALLGSRVGTSNVV
jgi:riboflavin kinase/FMN adenylyltransferase